MDRQENKKLFSAVDVNSIRHQISDFRQGAEVKEILIRKAEKQGKSHEEAVEIADQIMEETMVFDNLRSELDNDSQDAMESCLDAVDTADPDTRMRILNNIRISLEIIDDKDMLAIIADAKDKERAFEKLCGETPAWSAEEEAELKRSVLEKAESMKLLPSALTAMARRLKRNSCCVAAEAMGKAGYALKCIAAMNLYLNSTEMSVTECVAAAGSGVEIQALGDAVHRGLITEERAEKWMRAIIYAALAIAFMVIWYRLSVIVIEGYPTRLKTAAKAIVTGKYLPVLQDKECIWILRIVSAVYGLFMTDLSSNLLGGLIDKAAKTSSVLIGDLTTLLSGQISREPGSAAGGLERLSAYMEPETDEDDSIHISVWDAYDNAEEDEEDDELQEFYDRDLLYRTL